MMEAIMLCKSMIGSFGDSSDGNIPHEIINLYRDDDGDQYIYVPPYGGYNTQKYNVKYIFFTGPATILERGRKQWFEILYLVEVETLLPYVQGNIANPQIRNQMSEHDKIKNIRYGGKKLINIPFSKDSSTDSQITFYATFKANKIWKPKKKTLMGYGIPENHGCEIIELEQDSVWYRKDGNVQSKNYLFQRQKGYIPEIYEFDRGNRQEKDKNYEPLKKFIEEVTTGGRKKDWEEVVNINLTDNPQNDIVKKRKESFSLIRLMQREYDETAYSNLIYQYFAEKALLKAFIGYYNGELKDSQCKIPDDKYKIFKELYVYEGERNGNDDNPDTPKHAGRVDILLEGEENIIVIENKIKSGLNGLDRENGKSQLSLYYDIFKNQKGVCPGVERKKQDGTNKKAVFFILKPEYTEIDWTLDYAMKDEWKTCLSYKMIYDFLESRRKENLKDLSNNDLLRKYYDDFKNALYVHTLTRDEDFESRFLIALSETKECNASEKINQEQ